jgi:hypothetical protein
MGQEWKMRVEFIEVKTLKAARAKAPWAAKIVRVEGGYMAFESISDYATWRNQK